MLNFIPIQTNMTQRNPRDPPGMNTKRYHSKDLRGANDAVRSFLEKSKVAKAVIKTMAALGVSLVIAGM